MAQGEVNGTQDANTLQDALGSSSTKWRTAELYSLRERLAKKGQYTFCSTFLKSETNPLILRQRRQI